MHPDTVAVIWHKAAETKPAAISVLYRFFDPEMGDYVMGVCRAEVMRLTIRRQPVEWLPLALFSHSLYVDDNPDAVSLLPHRL